MGEPISFILAGNNPYENRGCEAIVRGTTKILRTQFRNIRFICLSHFQNDGQYQQQRENEVDKAITHLHSYRLSKKDILKNMWRPFYLGYAYEHFFRPKAVKFRVYKQMLPFLDDAAAVLSVGGDNYSLDYGLPTLFTDLDDIAIQMGKPIILWGASIGPFSTMPSYERYMSRHLNNVTGIYARESETIEYLRRIEVTRNVFSVADPAFLMDPERPKEIGDELPVGEGGIGLNLSPLMAKYVTGGDLEMWMTISASIIEKVAEATELPVYLIPHVTIPISDDYAFMKGALSRTNCKGVTLIPPKYDAAETKWIIGQLDLFAGARTHSTIAALSSYIPTLSFAYSIKAIGINRDMLGHDSYVHTLKDHGVEATVEKISSMIDNAGEIRRELRDKIPTVKNTAMVAGSILRKQIEEA